MQANTDNIFTKINSEISILELVQELGIAVIQTGKNFKALCPFHNDRNPSLSISVEKNIAFCMSCKTGGAPFTFFQKFKKLDVQATLEYFSKRLNLGYTYRPDPHEKEYTACEEAAKFMHMRLLKTNSGAEFFSYLTEKRRLSLDTIEHFQIGVALSDNLMSETLIKQGIAVQTLKNTSLIGTHGERIYDFFKNRVMFPLKNLSGKIVGFSGRALTESKDNPKYVNSPDTLVFKKEEVIYHLSDALAQNPEKEVILVEGFFDVVALFNAGFKNACATMGTTLTETNLNMLVNNTKSIVLMYDGDGPGQKAAENVAFKFLRFPKTNVYIVNIPNKQDPDEYFQANGKAGIEKLLSQKQDILSYFFNKIASQVDNADINSIVRFKNNFKEVFKYADQTVKDLFISKTKQKLNIDLSLKEVSEIKAPPKTAVKPSANSEIEKLRQAMNTLVLHCLNSEIEEHAVALIKRDILRHFEFQSYSILLFTILTHLIESKLYGKNKTASQVKVYFETVEGLKPEERQEILKKINSAIETVENNESTEPAAITADIVKILGHIKKIRKLIAATTKEVSTTSSKVEIDAFAKEASEILN